MPTFYSPTGNAEVWENKPKGYITVEEHNANVLAEYNKLDAVVERKLKQIDIATSGAILSGFTYSIDKVRYKFSYDTYDQQNFADTANMATLIKMNASTAFNKVLWNAYTVDDREPVAEGVTQEPFVPELVRLELDADTFLDLYVNGALKHKVTVMDWGAERKAAVLVAKSNNVSIDIIEEI